jgi:hypothetical protein
MADSWKIVLLMAAVVLIASLVHFVDREFPTLTRYLRVKRF